MSTYTFVVISPATTTRPVVISVSQATRPSGSSARTASSTESEIWSATLSGWPSVTDSEVKRNSRVMARQATGRLLDAQEEGDLELVRVRDGVLDRRPERFQVAADLRRDRGLGQLLDERHGAVDVDVQESVRLAGEPGRMGRIGELRALRERLSGVLYPTDPGGLVRDDE